MGRVGALQPRLARRRNGAQIAADIGGRQAETAQPCDHHMGKVLADAVALLEDFAQRRRDHGGLGIVFEARSGCDASGRPRRPAHRRPAESSRQRRRSPATAPAPARSRRRSRPASSARRLVAAKATSRTLSQAGLGAVRPGAWRATLTREREVDAQIAVRRLDHHTLGRGAEEVAPRRCAPRAAGGSRRCARSAPGRRRCSAPAAASSGRS